MLRRIMLVAARDYIASVFTKSFLIGLIVAPLMFGGVFFVMAIMRATQEGQERRIAIVDHTGQASPAIIQAVSARNDDPLAQAKGLVMSTYVLETVEPDTVDPQGQLLALSNRVRAEELFMFLEVGPGAIKPTPDEQANKVRMYASGSGIDDTRVWLVGAINTALHRLRLSRAGIDAETSDQLLAGVPIERVGLLARDPATGAIETPRPRNELESFIVPFALMFLMMMVVMGGSAPMLSVVAEDKMQRVYEMMLVSITPFELMLGKVLASLGRSITSSIVWVVAAVLGLQGAAMIGLVPFELLPWFFAYMVAEVVMLSALGAALGAACSTSRDAQSLAFLLILPVMIPSFLIVALLQAPNGTFSTVVSLLPPFTPMVMLLRQAMPGGVPLWQPWVGLAGVIAFALLITWAAGRIFRITILMQGKPPRLADLVRYAIQG